MPGTDGPSWNLVADFQTIWSYPSLVNAFRAGTMVALAAGIVGYFVVLRRQTFAAHTLALVGFPGAAAALLAGVSLGTGSLVFCVGAALALAALSRGGRAGAAAESAATGTLQACVLGAGYLFASLYHGSSEGISSLLFGNFLGITSGRVGLLAAGTGAVLVATAVLGRPLLTASVDPRTAAARGVPVRALGTVFLVLVGVAVAQAGQITGTLLVFALLVIPPATARELTDRPVRALALSAGLAVLYTWVSLFTAFYAPYPVGFFLSTFAFAPYAALRVARAGRAR